ncbi:MAG TPA: NPCBM/NEW2 domain-containing protein, partial [Gemmataceae bacterium]
SANVVYASGLTVTGDKVNAVTPSGVKIEFPRAALARLDYTKGKLAYLSDWDKKKWTKLATSTEDRIDHPRFDKNLDDGPIRLDNVTYPKGLSIHSRTELTFELDGEYREFKAIIGVDDLVNGSEGPTLVQIEDAATGKALHKTLEISRKTKPMDVTVNVQNVKSLRIKVTSPELLDLGRHVDLAEARVTK